MIHLPNMAASTVQFGSQTRMPRSQVMAILVKALAKPNFMVTDGGSNLVLCQMPMGVRYNFPTNQFMEAKEAIRLVYFADNGKDQIKQTLGDIGARPLNQKDAFKFRGYNLYVVKAESKGPLVPGNLG